MYTGKEEKIQGALTKKEKKSLHVRPYRSLRDVNSHSFSAYPLFIRKLSGKLEEKRLLRAGKNEN